MFCNQHGQFAIDGRVTCRENVADDFDVREAGASRSDEPLDQCSGRIKRRAWKRTKSGDKDRERHLDTEQFRDLLDRKRRCELAGRNLGLHLSQS